MSHDYDAEELQQFKDDCPGYNPIMTTVPAEKGRRIIAIGDTHGDWKITLDMLKLGKIISLNAQGKPYWDAKPKNTIVVQLGDQIDRCRPGKLKCSHKSATHGDEASDMRIMHLFNELHAQALKHGGAVYSLFGNHELMNANGDVRYASYANLEWAHNKYGSAGEPVGTTARIKAFAPGGEIAREMACTRTSMLIIGDALFVHAGAVPKLIDELPKIPDDPVAGLRWLNRAVRKWLLGEYRDKNMFSIMNSMDISPFWTRLQGYVPLYEDGDYYVDKDMDGNSKPSEAYKKCNSLVQETLHALHMSKDSKLEDRLDVKQTGKIIIGHTPQVNGLSANTTCKDSLVRVDIGASRAFIGIDGRPKNIERPIQVAEIIVGGGVTILYK